VVFGVSLLLRAFVAGIVVGESPFSHQIGADLLPFREAFAVVFFVSVGMLVDPWYVLAHWHQLALITAVIIGGKAIVSGMLAIVLGCSGRTTLILATGRSQIGEFSFILGQSGMALGILDENQYSLILAAAIVSITVNPLLVALVEPVERWLKRRPAIWMRIDRSIRGLPALEPEVLHDHVVIVGCGRVGRHIAETLGRLGIPRVVIEADPIRIRKLGELGVPVMYGDAASSEILQHAGLRRARALVITLPDDSAALAVVSTARKEAPDIHIIARASTWDGGRRLKADGAGEVVRPELEGGVEIVRRTLLELKLPVREIQRYTDLVRREGLDESDRPSLGRSRVLDDLVKAAGDLELGWLVVSDTSPLSGVRIVDASLRQIAGVSVVAISRERAVISNPGPEVIFVPGDRVALIGTPEQVAAVEPIFAPPA
jgi:CPA2 family monovalent cation:H+ antiporter-2